MMPIIWTLLVHNNNNQVLISLLPPAEHEMSIQLYYRSCDAGYHHIHAEGGCMLYFREPFEPEVKRNMQLIQLPAIKDISDEEVKGKPREYIGKILDCCDKGWVLLDSRNNFVRGPSLGSFYNTGDIVRTVYVYPNHNSYTPTQTSTSVLS